MKVKDILERIELIPNIVISDFRLIRKKHKVNQSGTLRVGFFCQYMPAWNKFEPVYNELKNRENVEVYVLCVPNGIKNDIPTESNEALQYFAGYENVIDTYLGDTIWFKVESLHLDYVFYTRPYNSFMPYVYNSKNVSNYTNICVISYGMNLTYEFERVVISPEFMKDVSLYFTEDYISYKRFYKLFPLTYFLGFRRAVFCGYPGLEQIILDKNKKCDISFDNNYPVVLWTPRWSTDCLVGGSNFFVYKETLINYAISHNINLIVRPHPLMFSNFLKTNQMSKDEIDDFKCLFSKYNNLFLDESSGYSSTFWYSDILISDISGIVPEYYVTNKPIIYCNSNLYHHNLPYFESILKTLYIVNSEKELIEYLELLINADDYKYLERERMIDTIFGDFKNSSKNIANVLLDEG